MMHLIKQSILLVGFLCLFIISSYAQAELEVEGDTEARIMIKSSSFINPTTLRFESGLPTGSFTNYIIRNQDDLLRFDVESDFIGNELGFFEVGPNTLRHTNLGQGSVGLLAANAAGDIFKISAQTKEISLPAQALNVNPNSTVITQSPFGLRWANSFLSIAFLSIKRPADWDGTSNLSVDVYFYPTTNVAGAIRFFGRHRDYNIGDDATTDAGSVLSGSINSTGEDELHKATITFTASQLLNEFWNITIQRATSQTSPYPDDVIVLNVTLRYQSSL